MFSTIILFILVLSILVFVHELGHFWTAKKMKMKVEEFGFGFPPKIKGWIRGETEYTLNWLPLGGFVRIKGESGEHKNDPDSFASQKAWRRLIVLVAGVIMNIILAAVLFSIGFMVGLPSVIDDNLPKGARVSDEGIHVMTIVEDSPAQEAQIQANDKLVSIDKMVFESDVDAREYIGENGEGGITMTLQRADDTFYEVELFSEDLPTVGIHGVGVSLAKTGTVSLPPHRALVQGVAITGKLTVAIAVAFYDILKDLVTKGRIGVDISGPVGIAVITGKVAAQGLIHLLQFTAILSINLAIINILPFPALDGGRVLFLIIEKVRRKPVDQKVEAIVHNLGFALLMVLVVLVTYRDFARYGGQMWDAVKGLIGG